MSLQSKKTKKNLFWAAKFLLAAALLAWIISGITWDSFFEALQRTNIPLLLCALGGYVLALTLIALRWWMLLTTLAIAIKPWEVIRLTFLGQFFNAVVPGTAGGDLVKAYYAAKHTPEKGAVLVTVFVDRLMGLTTLVVLAAIMLIVVLASGQETLDQLYPSAIAVTVALAGVVFLLVFLFSPGFRKLFHLQKLYRRLPIGHHIESARVAAVTFGRNIGALVKAIAMTGVIHSIWIGSIALVGWGLGLDVPWHHYFLYIPLIYVIGAVPITPGGVGLVEKAYLLFFASPNVEPGAVLALAVLARLLDIARGLPGIIVAVRGAKLPKSEALQAELGIDTPVNPPPA